MKTKSSVVSAFGLLLVLSAPSFSQTGKVAVGVDFGTSIIQIEPIFLVDDNFLQYDVSDFMIPQNIRGRVELGLSRELSLRLAAGYGFMKDESKFTRTFQFNNPAGSGRLYREVKFSVTGVPVEATLLWQVPLDDRQMLTIQFGLGGGFYSYKLKAERLVEATNSSDPSGNTRSEFHAPEVKLSGPAQFFMAGLGVRISSRARATFEISKLGFSMLKQQRDGDSDGFIEKQDYNSGAGLSDVALSLGINMNLSK